MIGHKHINFNNRYSISRNVSILFPEPLVKGLTLLYTNDVCNSPDGVNHLHKLFSDHAYTPITYPMIVELNSLILFENDMDSVPYDPIFLRADYWHNFTAQFQAHSPILILQPVPFIYDISNLFAVYSSIKVLKTAYAHGSTHWDPYWRSVFSHLIKDGWRYRTEMVFAICLQPILEVMLTTVRVILSKHSECPHHSQTSPKYGKFSFESMLRMYNKELRSPLKEMSINTWVVAFDDIHADLSDFTGFLSSTRVNYEKLCLMVKGGRGKRDLASLKMLLINSPHKIECDIYKLPIELLILIGGFLYNGTDLVIAVVQA